MPAPLEDFSDIHEGLRAKVAQDLLSHVVDGKWDLAKFNSRNDYQRHLYARFLRMAGVDALKVRAVIHALSDDVEPRKRFDYAHMVTYSHIVGFREDTNNQEVIPKVAG